MAISLRDFAGNIGYKLGGSFAEQSNNWIGSAPFHKCRKARRNFLFECLPMVRLRDCE
jgi:hypothetical protein